jgi:Protein of unknown function (DUF2851)
MTERLLQFIWQFQFYNTASLITEEGEMLQVIHPGTYNTNQGPDFIDAKIRINDTTWAGSIELHIRASDWNRHKHSNDPNYRNVILHVVWEQDVPVRLPFSTISLHDRVSKLLLEKYEALMRDPAFIPCQQRIAHVNTLTWQSWKERLLVERLEQRTRVVLNNLEKSNNHWDETCWWLLASNFGITLNSTAFEKLARSIPLNLLAKHKGQIHQTEALLFGQAGLLDAEFEEDYPKLLQKEYRFLKRKYALQKIEASMVFLRMRPSNFPTLRLFSKMRDATAVKDIKAMLGITANDYWHYHYVFDEPGTYRPKKLGGQMTDNIIINTIVPMLFAYGHYHKEPACMNKALGWLEDLSAEKNRITNGFAALGVANVNAFDSQALIQLKNEYCSKKRCLDCSIGNQLMRSDQLQV